MILSTIGSRYDIVIAGGGVTGAGIFHAALEKGYSALLLEAKDFAWRTSSRSSKMVHGGLRYLKQGKFLLTKSSVRERERLLKRYPGLVTPLSFIMPIFSHYGPTASSMKFGLSLYSLMSGKKQHRVYSKAETIATIPDIRKDRLKSAVGFTDAQVDDARLVLRLINDAKRLGGDALNYTKVECVLRDKKGMVAAIGVVDQESGETKEIKTTVLINATGVFAEQLHPSPLKEFHIRPLRGSHLIFPKAIFPINQVISFIHPKDLRPVFMFPWENVVILGTTDVDHESDINAEPRMTIHEADYLLEGVCQILPDLKISLTDSIGSMSGIRPVLSKKKKVASKESREHVVWKDKGLITVTGGKLTTFRLLANDALQAARPFLRENFNGQTNQNRQPATDGSHLNEDRNKKTIHERRLYARYGAVADQILDRYHSSLISPIEDTPTLWVELCHAAKSESICHLSDLLLRRARIGLQLQYGGKKILDQIQTTIAPYLSWNKIRWEVEKQTYLNDWQTCYSTPDM